MKYRIDECVVCGVMHPKVVINGWVENEANAIVVYSGNMEMDRVILAKSRSKVTTFYCSIPVNNSTSFDIFFEGKETVKICTITSHLMDRLSQKIYTHPIFKKIKFRKDRELQKEHKSLFEGTLSITNQNEYEIWLKENEFFSTKELAYQPMISIVMPVYNVPGKYLGYCLDSILNQTYQNFEVCIADDCSSNQDTIDTLKRYMEKDPRIKVVFRKENGHISKATNSALGLVSGEYVGLMDNDDKLEKHALEEVVKALNEDLEIDFIYTDEDKIDMKEVRSEPHFKPDFSIDTLYGGNYICHFAVIKKSLIDKIGGFRVGYEGAQDFDLFLRITEVAKKIHHIPKILYHWRMIPGSTAVGGDGAKNYAGEAGKKALEDYFNKKNIKVNIDNMISTHYFVEYLFDEKPLIEVLVINDEGTNIDSYLKMLKQNTLYDNYQITVITENSNIENMQVNKIIDNNLCRGINKAVSKTKAEYIAILDKNTIIESVDWLDIFIGYCKQDHIGVVCGKVLDKKNVTRATGIIFGDKGPQNAYPPTFRNDGGLYGRLLVPYSYLAVNHYACMIRREKFVNLNIDYSVPFAVYDLCMNVYKKENENISIPQVVFVNDDAKKISLDATEEFLEKWAKLIKRDPYYNCNLSKRVAFRLGNKA